MGCVNCYLVEVDTGYVLIDTGSPNKRAALEREIKNAGCEPGNLRLIVLTHGDFDHSGNAAYLRERFDTKVAMHHDDWGMVERGDMFWNRKRGFSQRLIGTLVPLLFGFGKSERLVPNLHVEDGYDLSAHGFGAKVIIIPGHSKGSIAILTEAGDLFCGDLFTNIEEPALNSIMDDREAEQASVRRLKDLGIVTVYPGHGGSFGIFWQL
jgi:glyoxylase-like metal-dependent hydrolase (beta-lactamase superfamily II)